MRTERLTILVSPQEKAAIAARAKELGLSVGETLRFAFQAAGQTSVDDAFLEAFMADVERTMEATQVRIDESLGDVARVVVTISPPGHHVRGPFEKSRGGHCLSHRLPFLEGDSRRWEPLRGQLYNLIWPNHIFISSCPRGPYRKRRRDAGDSGTGKGPCV